MATISLNLDTSNAHARRRLEVLYCTMFNLRRALQRDAQRLCREYWVRKDERGVLGWKFVADDLGLNRRGFEMLAREHARASGWAMNHVSAALVYHMSNAVFEDVVRHLWSDNSDKRHGRLRITPACQFSTIHGRASSHTTAHKWETFRLYGTLDGHLDAYGHAGLGEHPTLDQVAALVPGVPVLRRNTMSTPRPTKWSRYAGPLVSMPVARRNRPTDDLLVPQRLHTAGTEL